MGSVPLSHLAEFINECADMLDLEHARKIDTSHLFDVTWIAADGTQYVMESVPTKAPLLALGAYMGGYYHDTSASMVTDGILQRPYREAGRDCLGITGFQASVLDDPAWIGEAASKLQYEIDQMILVDQVVDSLRALERLGTQLPYRITLPKPLRSRR